MAIQEERKLEKMPVRCLKMNFSAEDEKFS